MTLENIELVLKQVLRTQLSICYFLRFGPDDNKAKADLASATEGTRQVLLKLNQGHNITQQN